MSVRGVILAAGLGRRMGALKQLLPLNGRPLLQYAIDAARTSDLVHVLLVLGHAHAEILADIDARGIDVVVNPDFAAGQSTSVRAGLHHGPDADGVMFLLGDQPLIKPALINTLIDRFVAERPPAVVPAYRGRPGNPAVIGRALLDEVDALSGDTGARPLLRRHARRVLEVEVDDPAILRDVDTMDDYLSLPTPRGQGTEYADRKPGGGHEDHPC